ncbi:phage tail protein [Draconibacterium halophilum]|uniref:phage tail protein n=1 Tax=Draconibacterium halophilum TaxID=2706887 RepID=UPI0037445FE7
MHAGQSTGSDYQLGQKSGEETHTLTAVEIPSHSHNLQINNSDGVNTKSISDNTLSKSKYETRFSNAGPANKSMKSDSIENSGGGQAHNNEQPSLTLNYCIALQGLFPSRN